MCFCSRLISVTSSCCHIQHGRSWFGLFFFFVLGVKLLYWPSLTFIWEWKHGKGATAPPAGRMWFKPQRRSQSFYFNRQTHPQCWSSQELYVGGVSRRLRSYWCSVAAGFSLLNERRALISSFNVIYGIKIKSSRLLVCGITPSLTRKLRQNSPFNRF